MLFLLRPFLIAKARLAPCVLMAVLLLSAPAIAEQREGVIGPESRVLLGQFDPSPALDARKIRRKLGATHRMICEDQAATANIVATNDTVITVAHLLVRPDGSRRDIRKCVLIVDRNGKATRYPVRSETLKIGSFKGADRRTFGLLDITNDWMIVKLRRPVRGITPYGLATDADGGFYPGKVVTTVSALSDNWPSRRESTRLAERCAMQDMLGGTNKRHAVLIVDCDVGFGSSGGAILVGLSTDRPRLIACSLTSRKMATAPASISIAASPPASP